MLTSFRKIPIVKKILYMRKTLHNHGFYGVEAFRVFLDMYYCGKKFHCTREEYFRFQFYNQKNRIRKYYLLRYHQCISFDLVNTGSNAIYGADKQYTLFQKDLQHKPLHTASASRAELEHFIRKHGIVTFKPCCDTSGLEAFTLTAEEIKKTKKLSKIAGKDYLCEPIFENGKERQYVVFHDRIGRQWMYVTSENRSELEDFIRKHGKVIFKPNIGSLGQGIFALTADEIGERLTQKLADIAGKEYLCEEYVRQHPALSEMSPGTVNTIRVVSLCDGQSVKMLFGSLRTGAGDGVCDNMASGGVGVVIDMETGISVSTGIDSGNTRYYYHPVTGTKMIGFEIPYWNEVKEMITECALRLRADAILGWDIAITDKGPCIIEVNRHPEAGKYAQIVMNRPTGKEIIQYINANRRSCYKAMPKEIRQRIKKARFRVNIWGNVRIKNVNPVLIPKAESK